MALITIGIPIFNEERYLAKTIESVLSQNFSDFTLIISDNCSTDTSYEIAQYYAKGDARIEVTRHSTDIGPPENFKYSRNIAETRYFAWLSGHDLYLKDYLQEAIAVLENDEHLVLVYPKSSLIDVDDKVIGDAYDDIDTTGLSLRKKLLKVAQNLYFCTGIHGIFKTEVLKQLPWEYMIGSDHLLLFVAAMYGDIQMLQTEGLQYRQVRVETFEQAKKRWLEWGCVQESIDTLSPHTTMTLKHVEYIWKQQNISLNDKIVLLLGVKKILSERFGVRWRDLLREKYPAFNTAYLLARKIKYRIVFKGNICAV